MITARRSLTLVSTLAAAGVLALPAAARAAGQWFKTDTHVHSVVSGDAIDDVGILSQKLKAKGYNAAFLTDHEAGSNFPISTVIANHIAFDDDYGSKWLKQTSGSQSASANELVTSPVVSGTSSMHLLSTSSSSGETFTRIKRGPNLRSGGPIIKFSVYPKRIDSGSGLYVSASIGGDPTVASPDGYTTQAGAISPGKSTVLVWQLGSARAPSTNSASRVITYQLPYTLNTWNTYEIDVSTGATKRNGATIDIGSHGLADVPSADRPLDYNALTQLKMAAHGNGGTAEGYFDAYHADASAPVPSGQEFVYRNSVIHNFDTSSFTVFPSVEMGFNRHAQRFNFGITQPSEYNSFFGCDSQGNNCKLTNGTSGILPTQQTGYLAQLNHPNLPGGVKLSEIQADNYQAFGADQMEVRYDRDGVPPTTMIDIWDSMLQHGTNVLGTWGSDSHQTATFDDALRGVATYVNAPVLDFNQMMRSMFEGRSYLARNSFGGRIVFNRDSASQEPYPARYPVYVSDAATSAPAHLAISGGIGSGWSVRWIVNGATVATDATTAASFDKTRPVALSGSSTYARVELHDASNAYIAMSQPLVFKDVAGLPADMSVHVDGVSTPDGRGYTKLTTQGIDSASWNATSEALSTTLKNPTGSLVELAVDTGTRQPGRVVVDGSQVPKAASLADYQAATGSSWYFDATAHLLRIKDSQASGTSSVRAEFGSADNTAPSTPTSLKATAPTGNRVDLSWSAASDNVGVDGYTIYRDGAKLDTVGGSTLSYSDTTVAPGSTHSYTVDAFDASGNHSAQSSPVSVTTPSTATVTLTPAADAYVDSTLPTSNFGTSVKLRTDGSPLVRSFLRFNVQGVAGTVTRATLRIFANTSNSAGYEIHGVADDTWSETGINYNNQPAFASAATGSSGAVTASTWSAVDVTPLVTGNGLVSFAMTSPSTTATSFASRETGATTAPQLVIQTSG
jgi:hypothetical protein